jgi:peptidoglycan hydrolase-like protein with peptidoglycan-binding domain
MLDSIEMSVGEGGANRKKDVAVVQLLLNRVRAQWGVPEERLEVDGIVGPKTLGAIRQFQEEYLGFADGRVDPHNKTLDKLNQMAPALPPLNDGVSFLEPYFGPPVAPPRVA